MKSLNKFINIKKLVYVLIILQFTLVNRVISEIYFISPKNLQEENIKGNKT